MDVGSLRAALIVMLGAIALVVSYFSGPVLATRGPWRMTALRVAEVATLVSG